MMTVTTTMAQFVKTRCEGRWDVSDSIVRLLKILMILYALSRKFLFFTHLCSRQEHSDIVHYTSCPLSRHGIIMYVQCGEIRV